MMANAAPGGENINASRAGSNPDVTRKKRILIVDDERDITVSIKAALGTSYRVDIGGTASQAIHSYKSGAYDLILLDYRMPNMDGFAFYQQIKTIDPKVKFCFITAYEELNSKVTNLKWRNKVNSIFQDDTELPVLRKPFDSATLKGIVAHIIGE
jgi:DNA-binding NtrC family response regulator